VMRSFFVIMLIVSVVSAPYGIWTGIVAISHNQYRGRHDLLDTNRQQPDHLSPHLGLTPKELAQCDPYVAEAYKQSVYDGYKLGTFHSGLGDQCLILSAFLFITSLLGIRALSKAGAKSNQPAAPNAGNASQLAIGHHRPGVGEPER
jgi:hypothetical protein